ncbi:hypothetical protein [Sphingobacterium athyrii]|uniref:Uncharacterized protein n=1 Tax=Sphingobacterium athyrii TaxID=2152717 RepID=A0A363P005_9SPHI|nr:hypothetical protein [Sphingobacterium athyrii]PUV26320.1 hypothetical protein DCO56_05040 [Sphingobacterium athyrii]
MEVKFRIVTLGYIVAEISSETKRFKIGHSSDYGDKFQELLNKFFFIYEIIKEKDVAYFPYSTTVLWEDDRVNYNWTISMNSVDSHINIKIDQLSSSNLDYKEMLIHENIETRKLFDAIYQSLEEMLADFGFVGYKKKWEVGNFPIAEYITLKAARERIDLRHASCLEEDEWKQKMDPNDELGVINISASNSG